MNYVLSSLYKIHYENNNKKNQLSFAKEIEPIIVFKTNYQISVYRLTSLLHTSILYTSHYWYIIVSYIELGCRGHEQHFNLYEATRWPVAEILIFSLVW